MSPTTTGPLFRATRAEKPASPRALRAALHAVSSRWISTAARAARRAWSACGTGAPKKAITQSPMNLSSVPPARKIASTERSRKAPSSSETSSGRERSQKAVKPTKSAKSTVACASCGR